MFRLSVRSETAKRGPGQDDDDALIAAEKVISGKKKLLKPGKSTREIARLSAITTPTKSLAVPGILNQCPGARIRSVTRIARNLCNF